MRLIVEYVISDEYTYSFTTTVPVVVESKEWLREKLRVIAERHIANSKQLKYEDPVFVCGKSKIDLSYCISSDRYYEPNIYTIDEWFEANGFK